MKKLALVLAVVAALVLGTVFYASAAGLSANDTVNVSAMANPKLTLTLDHHAIDFGPQDPGAAVTTGTPVIVTVDSNKVYDLAKQITNGGVGANMGLTTDFADVTGHANGTASWTDHYTVNIPFSTLADVPLSASVKYTVTQN